LLTECLLEIDKTQSKHARQRDVYECKLSNVMRTLSQRLHAGHAAAQPDSEIEFSVLH